MRISHRLLRVSPRFAREWLRRALLVVAVTMSSLSAEPSVAFAQNRPAETSTSSAEREVLSLQQQLAVVNAEVRALKQGPRNLSTDYRLRQRLSDAEALGRKLTDAESRLRAGRRAEGKEPESSVVSGAGAMPRAAATDGPAELAAKADILLDQAGKLVAQADRLEQRADRERQRNTLRARARHLEQDPFIGLESSKRNIAFSSRSAPVRGHDDGVKAPASDSLAGGDANGAESSPPPAAPTGAPGYNGTPQPQTGGNTAPPPAPVVDGNSGSVSVAFRALLDAGTLAQIERIEGSGDPRARAKAVEAVVAALRKQARDLQAQAQALKTQR